MCCERVGGHIFCLFLFHPTLSKNMFPFAKNYINMHQLQTLWLFLQLEKPDGGTHVTPSYHHVSNPARQQGTTCATGHHSRHQEQSTNMRQ